ncbi:NUDIX domain-containing protein [Candidatus Saccharibacteria bacterium]|nr:NUDIX domain-containing protein [Candidatus Saccharibacteria bacterium]
MKQTFVTCVDIDGNEHEVAIDTLQWRPSAYAIVIRDGHLLVSRQFNGFDLPGGGVDLGELPDAAAIRETKEETGIDVNTPEMVGAHSNFFKLPTHNNDRFVQSILMYYRCSFVGGELSMDGFDEFEKEHGDMPEWLPLAELDTIQLASSFDWRAFVRRAL